MKKSRFAALALLSIVLLSSCNKGVGCPNSFSFEAEVLTPILQMIQQIF